MLFTREFTQTGDSFISKIYSVTLIVHLYGFKFFLRTSDILKTTSIFEMGMSEISNIPLSGRKIKDASRSSVYT